MPIPRPAYDRVMKNVAWDGRCLVWLGTRTGSPNSSSKIPVYGVIVGDHSSLGGDGKPKQVHRVVWEHERGPIPLGMTIDHTCNNTVCVLIDHLQIATRAENTRLRWVRTPASDTCKKGHKSWKYNTVRSGKEKGRVVRRCRDCDAERARR